MKVKRLSLRQGIQKLTIAEDCEVQIKYLGTGSSTKKSQLLISHTKPHLTSRIKIKSVLQDQSHLDLEAKLIIEKEAVDTDTYLKIDTLLIGDDARARAVPSLEIKTDNVKAGHGATIGQIDPDQMYYLMSRGLNKQAAQDLIIQSFINS